jgi:hypothetical protein
LRGLNKAGLAGVNGGFLQFHGALQKTIATRRHKILVTEIGRGTRRG